MIGSPVLILGHCIFDDTEEYWTKYQNFTAEEYLNIKYTYDPTAEWSACKSQEEADKMAAQMTAYAKSRAKYHGKVVHFDSINKDVKVHQEVHDIHLGDAEPVEITKAEWELLGKELNADQWQDFDWETWGK